MPWPRAKLGCKVEGDFLSQNAIMEARLLIHCQLFRTDTGLHGAEFVVSLEHLGTGQCLHTVGRGLGM